jgi:hypothetical protein
MLDWGQAADNYRYNQNSKGLELDEPFLSLAFGYSWATGKEEEGFS